MRGADRGTSTGCAGDRPLLPVRGLANINNTISFPGLTDWGARKPQRAADPGQLFKFMGIPGIMAFPAGANSLGGGIFGQDLGFVVQTTESHRN